MLGEYVKSLGDGEENIYARFDVMVQAFNEIGDGPRSNVVTIRSAEGSKSTMTHALSQEPVTYFH